MRGLGAWPGGVRHQAVRCRAGPALQESDTACCYAVQDKVWVSGPGGESWEVYTVKADADTLTKAGDSACCNPGAAAGETPGPPEKACVC